MTNAELADEIERRMKDSSPVEDFAVFLASNAAAIIAALRRPESDRAYTPLHDFIEAQEELDPQNRDNLYRNIWAMYSTAACPPDIPAERQPSSDQVLVPRDIHPLDNPNGDKVIKLLMNPPSAEKFSDPNDYYDYWWSLLLAAAEAEGKP